MILTRLERSLLAVASAAIVAALIAVVAAAPAADESPARQTAGEREGAPDEADGTQPHADGPEDGTAQPAPETQAGSEPAPAPPVADPAPDGAVEPMPTAPTRPGSYRYRESGQDPQGRSMDGESTMTVTASGGTEAEPRQTVRHSGGVSGDHESEVVWRSDGKLVERTVFAGFGGGTCEWEPPLLELRLPLGSGTSWSFDSSCQMTMGAQEVTVRVNGSLRVTGAERAEVGGRSVDVWVIEGESQQHFAAPQGGMSFDVTHRSLYAPGHGLVVRSTDQMRAQGSDDSGTITKELVSLDPS